MKILHLEDSPRDAAYVAALLAEELPLCQITLVESPHDYEVALQCGQYDLVLSDFNLKGYDGLSALQLAREHSPTLPFIFLSGSLGEELATETVRAGAYDYVLKDRIKRLPTAIRHAVDGARERHYRQLAEEAQLRLVDILENTTDFVAIAAPDGRLLYLNRAGLHMTGRAENTDVSSLTTRDFQPPESDVSIFGLGSEENRASNVRSGETTLFTSDGRLIPVSQVVIAHRSADTGKIEYFSTVLRDLSAQKAVERLLREQSNVISKAREAIIICNLESCFTFWNHGAERILGWTAAEVLGRPDRDIFSPEVSAQIALARSAIEQTGEWRGELHVKNKSGQPVVIELSLTTILNDAGQPQAHLGICTDITEKKKLHEQFLRAQRLESIGLLAAGIAHDLNNVLAPMLLAVPMLRDSAASSADRAILVSLEGSAQRGAALVRQILDFVRGVSGVARNIDLGPLLHELAGMITGTFPKNIRLEEFIPPGLPYVKANPTQIYQVLLNLAVNARDAMPDGGIIRLHAERRVFDELTAAACPDARPGTYLAIELEDTGTGIPPEVLASIWEPFFTTKGASKGTGLGLSTVRGIIETHGGFVTVSTTPGHGSTFGVCLPEVPPAAGAGSPLAGLTALRGKGELILVVEDEAMIRDIATATLSRHGYRVLAARDGTEAVTLFAARSKEIPLVITDLNMPNLAGPALAGIVRRFNPAVKIIAMSGVPFDDEGARSDTPLIDAFIAKPFTIESLLFAVHKQLQPPARP